jgi:hypothetical protein
MQLLALGIICLDIKDEAKSLIGTTNLNTKHIVFGMGMEDVDGINGPVKITCDVWNWPGWTLA